MGDQVEIMAAEDAPSNNESGDEVSSAQPTAAQPEAETVAEMPTLDEPAAEAAKETPVSVESVAEAVAEMPTLDQSAAQEAVGLPPQAESPAQESAVSPVAGSESQVLDHNLDADKSAAVATPGTPEAKSNVRILSVGQQVTGTIKRIADFGAFVDIGVGRDGLIHISELSVRRVGKVTDVLAEGQEVTAWIKKLDRDRNRISLTLIDPNTKTIRDLNKDDVVRGTVTRILPYGAFVDIGIGRDALLHVREMGVGYVAKPEDVVKVGDTIEARIIELSRRRGRVDLSLKGLREEPEPTPQPQAQPMQPWPAPQTQQQPQTPSRQQPPPEPEDEEDIEDLEVLSPMELAFKRAMEAEGMELNVSKKKQGKRNRRERNRSLQDEIISRTLSSGRK
jgi:predicted RNA-binding protein with RPS1 domain